MAGAAQRRGEFTFRAGLIDKITSFAIRYNRAARPWRWADDARADHAQYHARHTSPHPAQPSADQALSLAAYQQCHYQTRPSRTYAGLQLVLSGPCVITVGIAVNECGSPIDDDQECTYGRI
jgi:hypothetical protein